MTDSTPGIPQVWWKTIDFRPAPAGWRVVSLFEDRRSVLPMPGWLIQERYLIDAHDKVVSEPNDGTYGRERRVAPGITVEGYDWCVQPTDENMRDLDATWMVLAPDQPEPSDEERAVEVQRRATVAAKRAAAQTASS